MLNATFNTSLFHVFAMLSAHVCFALTVVIPDKPPAVIRLPQHLNHRADGHRNFIVIFSGVAPHGTIKDT